MEENSYPKMRRPKRQLCYLRSKENPPKQWEGPLTLEDVDRMFDDLDSPPKEDIPSPAFLGPNICASPNFHKGAISPIPHEGHHMVPDKDALHPVSRSVAYKLDVDLDVPLTLHGLAKTSSPIEQMTGVSRVEKQYNEEAVPEILLYLEDEVPKSMPRPSKQQECNEQVTEESGISELETPPEKFVLPKLTSNKKKPEASQRQVNTEHPSVARRQEPALPTADNKSKTVHRKPPVETTTRLGNNMTTFLQKLKEAGQSKLACPRKSVVPVKVSIPEPEDDFVILEDDATFQFSIPSKNAPRKTQKQSRTSISDKDSSTDKGSDRESQQKRSQDQEDLEKVNVKLGSLAADQKTKAKKKEKEETRDERPESTKDEMLREQEKPNKNQLKVQSKVNDTAKNPFKDKASPANPSRKTKHKPYEVKKSECSKASKESIKTTRTKASKGSRKRLQSSEVNEMDVDVKKQVQEDPEELCAPAENHLVMPDTSGNAQQSKPMAESPGKSSEDEEVFQKRKRRPPGPWWRTDLISLSSEETDNQQPTVKKSKQNSKEPKVAARSPVKDKKDKVFKKRSQKDTALSSPHSNKAKGKEIKQNKKRNKSGNTPQKKVETEETFKSTDEQQPEEEEVHEVDQDEEESSPLAFNLREQTISSGGKIFQKVYHHTPVDKISPPHAAPSSHRQPEELLKEAEPTKRRRKQTGSWWLVNNNNNNNMADIVETAVPPKRQLLPALKKSKPQKKREEQPEQNKSTGLSNNSTVDVSLKPAEGAPVSPLKLKPHFTPKTVKRSLAKFTDIFATGLETPARSRNGDTQLKNRRNVASRPAEEKATSDGIIPSTSNTDVPSVDGGEDVGTPSVHDLHNQQTPQDDKRQTESASHCFRSGPCSMIELEEHEENDSMTLPTSRVQALLCPSDLCSLPLKPLVLQSKDKSNLAEWFKSLWATTAKNGAAITPDQFDWFYYKDKAMGLHVELNAGSVCYGKMMLGSQMKKPLWVDHSATTVFHLLTSSVSLTVDGCESYFNPGQSFMVDCGHAYSIQNITSQPAMLYFTRMSADSSD